MCMYDNNINLILSQKNLKIWITLKIFEIFTGATRRTPAIVNHTSLTDHSEEEFVYNFGNFKNQPLSLQIVSASDC